MEPRLYILFGTDKGKTFDLKYDKIYTVGRSPDNDIQIKDKTVSRHHLTIQYKESKYLITDLNSKNGTFITGKDISAGIEVEVEDKIPIVIGMNVIGLGEECGSWLKNFLDSIDNRSEIDKDKKVSKSYGIMEIKKNIRFIFDMNNILLESKDINEILEKMLECLSNLFKDVDRCAIVLIDGETEDISKVISRSKKSFDDPAKAYNHDFVEQALILNKPVIFSDSYDGDHYEDDETTKSLRLESIRSAVCVPLNSPRLKRGALYMDSPDRSYRFRKNDIALLENICCRVALTMDYLSLDEKLVRT
jgi:adenylate cyclase